ncbi:MAG: sugar ABC transporter ATP-binding protein [Anaerolineae bacterium]|jgi:ribose transport system ATP-binding protein|nr:sugar ABC transporter ATP-binding protein [Anaerolineae bacterium]
MNDVLVKMEGIDKVFPGVHALDHCQFDLKPGEVHALVGENGAGKSTLMKCLSGIYHQDEGVIFLKGEEVKIPNPRAAQNLGISIIHQELNLMSHLTVAQNIFIGREKTDRSRIFLDEKWIETETKRLLNMLHLDIDPRTKAGDLTVAKQQMVEIAKALSFNSDVLIMDEPTASLTESEIEDLFTIIRSLRSEGVGIIYISHRMEELKKISDRITVMRDGKYIDTLPTATTNIGTIINLMVGRTIYADSPHLPENAEKQPVVLEVKNLNRGKEIKDVSFYLKKGEILGFAGLMGAGRTEVARAIFGADPIDSGEIYINGELVHIHHPKDAVAHGLGYLSEDRKRYGVVIGMDVENNTVMASFKEFLKALGIVDEKATRTKASEYVEKLDIRTPSITQKVKFLSGGNQQKVVVGKWLTADSEIIIFDEPTRGIDVGAKSEIYNLLNDLAAQGKSIIMISSELEEILRMSHRIVVMCEGRKTGELTAEEADQVKIMTFATMRNGAEAEAQEKETAVVA